MPTLSKTLLPLIFTFTVFYSGAATVQAQELDIQWSNNKISIKAKDVTLCELLDELAEKTNTRIRNDNKCDYPVNINVKSATFDEAIKKIFKKDSYVLVDDDNERRLLVFNRSSSQYDNNVGVTTSNPRGYEPIYLPESTQPDPSSISVPGTPNYDQYQDPNAMDREQMSPEPVNPDQANTPMTPDAMESPIDPETAENGLQEEGVAPPESQ